MFNDEFGNPNYNLDYDLHVLNPENKDTKDYQVRDCLYDALQRVDNFMKAQIIANQNIRNRIQILESQRGQGYYGR